VTLIPQTGRVIYDHPTYFRNGPLVLSTLTSAIERSAFQRQNLVPVAELMPCNHLRRALQTRLNANGAGRLLAATFVLLLAAPALAYRVGQAVALGIALVLAIGLCLSATWTSYLDRYRPRLWRFVMGNYCRTPPVACGKALPGSTQSPPDAECRHFKSSRTHTAMKTRFLMSLMI
jgi:hypothetical protein